MSLAENGEIYSSHFHVVNIYLWACKHEPSGGRCILKFHLARSDKINMLLGIPKCLECKLVRLFLHVGTCNPRITERNELAFTGAGQREYVGPRIDAASLLSPRTPEPKEGVNWSDI